MRNVLLALAVLFLAVTIHAQVGPNGAPPPSTGTPHSATLSWVAPAPVSGVTYAGVNVYRGVQRGGPYGKLNTAPIPVATTQFVDTTATPGVQQFVVLTSQSTAGAESAWSTEATYTLPSNGNPPTGINVIVAALIKLGKAIYAGLHRFAGIFG